MSERRTQVLTVLFPDVVGDYAFSIHKPGCKDIERGLAEGGGTAVPIDLDLNDPEWCMAQIDDQGLGYIWDDVKVFGCVRMARRG